MAQSEGARGSAPPREAEHDPGQAGKQAGHLEAPLRVRSHTRSSYSHSVLWEIFSGYIWTCGPTHFLLVSFFFRFEAYAMIFLASTRRVRSPPSLNPCHCCNERTAGPRAWGRGRSPSHPGGEHLGPSLSVPYLPASLCVSQVFAVFLAWGPPRFPRPPQAHGLAPWHQGLEGVVSL